MISSSNEQLQQQLEYTLHQGVGEGTTPFPGLLYFNLIATASEFQKSNLDMRTL